LQIAVYSLDSSDFVATAFVCIQSYFHHPIFGQARSLPEAVRAVKRHGFRANRLTAKGIVKAFAYLACLLFLLFLGLVVQELAALK